MGGVPSLLPPYSALLLLSSLWDRYELGSKTWLRGRAITIGSYSVHSFSLVAGLLFIAMGSLACWFC